MLVNNLLLLVAIFVVFAVLATTGSASALAPILILITLFFAMSIGLLLGVLNVFMRDIGQVVPVVLQALFWLTPIVYNIRILPEHVQGLFKLNPLYPLVSYQNVLLYDQPPVWADLAWLVGAACVLALASLIVSVVPVPRWWMHYEW